MMESKKILILSLLFYKYLEHLENLNENQGYFIKEENRFNNINYKNVNDILNELEVTGENNYFYKLFSFLEKPYKEVAEESLHLTRKMKLDSKDDYVNEFNKIMKTLSGYSDLFLKELVLKLAKFKKQKPKSVYDPTLGYGNFIIKAYEIYGDEVGYYGEEVDHVTYSLAKMNLFINGVNINKTFINNNNSILNGSFKNKKFDLILSEPPHDLSENPNFIKSDLIFQFHKDIANFKTKSLTDYSFVLQGLTLLNDDGVFVTVVPPGLMFNELSRDIRELMIDKYYPYLDTLIRLPEKEINNVNVSLHILLFSFKEKISENDVFVIDYINKKLNEDREKAAEEIYKIRHNRKEIKGISRFVSKDEMIRNEFNLNLSRYITKEVTKYRKDIQGLIKDNEKLFDILEEKSQTFEDILKELKNK